VITLRRSGQLPLLGLGMGAIRKNGKRREVGVALVSALLVVSLATIAAVAMASRQHLDIRRTSNLLDRDQAMLYAVGAEGWAAHLLVRDREDGEVDHLGEEWAYPLAPVAVEGGDVGGQIEDLQGRFNLNSLAASEEAGKAALARFRRLLEALELDPVLAEAVADWIDADIEARLPDGAEDDEYLGLKPAYRTANALMVSPSELRLVKGFGPEVYAAIAPYVTALPEATTINVNTASARVIMSLADGIAETDAESIIGDRGEDGFPSVAEFLKHDALAGLKITPEGLAVSSSYFALRSEAHIGRSRAQLYSVLKRGAAAGETEVVMRSRGWE